MWYLPIEWRKVENLKDVLARIDVVIDCTGREKRAFNIIKKVSYAYTLFGSLTLAITPLNILYRQAYCEIGIKEIASTAVVGLTGLAMCYYGRISRKWASKHEKIAQERQNELLEERVEFLRMKKENEQSPAYQALVN
ncbi:MAG: hypothetical protein QW666_01105 [Candidatus Woesearchaeota archaeon]